MGLFTSIQKTSTRFDFIEQKLVLLIFLLRQAWNTFRGGMELAHGR